MNEDNVRKAAAVAKEFLSRVAEVQKRLKENDMLFYGSRETAALRRTSMELTRALAEMRK